METAMRFAPHVLLAILVWSFLGLGFFGLYQQVTKQIYGSHTSIEEVR
jgi:hypothetical protein